MKRKLLGAVSIIALGAAFGVGTPGAANASLTCTGSLTTGNCSETDSVSVSDQDFTNVSIPVDYFTAPHAGDVLHSVTYSVGGTIETTGTLSNTGPGTASGLFVIRRDNFTFAGGTPSSFLNPAVSNIGSGFTSPTVTLAPGAKSVFSISNPYDSANFFPGTAGYTNTGTFDALVNTATARGPGSTPSYFSATSTLNETAFVTITYNYTAPVPEPAGMAMLGVGLAGFGAIRRRRKA